MTMKRFFFLSAMAAVVLTACSEFQETGNSLPELPSEEQELRLGYGLRDVATVVSALPIDTEQIREVHDAVSSSSQNGYDEEYTMKALIDSPGSGVGSSDYGTRAGSYSRPIRDLLQEYLESRVATKSASAVQSYLDSLSRSDIQIYWPFSEEWDGHSRPLITFDPGYGAESNYAYETMVTESGLVVTDSVWVTEKTAMERPIWVINRNSDSAFTPLDFKKKPAHTKAANRTLYLKSIKMLRNYDSWFGGASEFRIQCGGVENFTASTEAELKLYFPTVTEFVVVVRRKYLGVDLPVESIILTDFTNQLDKLAFLVTEDDGGDTTSWKCSATVKVKSKSYGFDVEIPYKDKDDVVWRGQLSASFFQKEDIVTGRFGDLELTFELD